MVGVDATHAWHRSGHRRNQWLGLDPPTTRWSTSAYIVVGFGRDYADVPPLRGIIYTDSEKSVIDVSWTSRRSRRRMLRRSTAAAFVRDFTCPIADSGWRSRTRMPVLRQCARFSLADKALLVIAPGPESEHAGAVDEREYRLCANLHVAECNWLVEKYPAGRLCASCALTRTRPATTTSRPCRHSRTRRRPSGG